MVNACIEALLSFASDDFADATQRMRFPREHGFSGPLEMQCATVFGRAVIAEALACAIDRAPHVVPTVEHTLAQLLTLRRGDGSGWAYFPHLRELPSDVDDLAAVLRALVRAHGRSYAAACAHEPLFRWLATLPDDGCATAWVASSDPDIHALQTRWIAREWDDAFDAAAIAHMLLALDDLGASGVGIDALRDAIARAQHEDGRWTSPRYPGGLYATMMATSALCTDARHDGALRAALAAIAAARRGDGGWGYAAGSSDALTTAFALLALSAIATRIDSPEIDALARAGVARLAQLRRDRTASPVPFISGTFGSAAICAAYTLKAALAWEHAIVID